MMKLVVRFGASLVAAACVLVMLYCPFGYIAAAEPGMEKYRTILPIAFVIAAVLGAGSALLARRA